MYSEPVLANILTIHVNFHSYISQVADHLFGTSLCGIGVDACYIWQQSGEIIFTQNSQNQCMVRFKGDHTF